MCCHIVLQMRLNPLHSSSSSVEVVAEVSQSLRDRSKKGTLAKPKKPSETEEKVEVNICLEEINVNDHQSSLIAKYRDELERRPQVIQLDR